MPDTPTLSDLYKAKAITDDQVAAAVAAYLKGGTSPADIGSHRVDIAAAVEAHKPAQTAMADESAAPAFLRTMVRTAVLLARPESA